MNALEQIGPITLGVDSLFQERLTSGFSYGQKITFNAPLEFIEFIDTPIDIISFNQIDQEFHVDCLEFPKGWDWGYRLIAGWESCDSCISVDVSWEHNFFQSKVDSTAHFTLQSFTDFGPVSMGDNIIFQPGYFIPMGSYITTSWNALYSNLYLPFSLPPNFIVESEEQLFGVSEFVSGQWTTTYDILKGRISRTFSVSEHFCFKPYLEGQIHWTREDINSLLSIQQNDDVNVFDADAPFSFSSQSKTTQSYLGAGLDLGFEALFDLGCGLYLYGLFDTALLISTTKVTYSEKTNAIQYIMQETASGVEVENSLEFTEKIHTTKQLLHWGIGVEWNHCYGSRMGVKVHAGWEVHKYINHYFIPKYWVEANTDIITNSFDPQDIRPTQFPNNKAPVGDLAFSGFVLGLSFFF